MEKEIQRDLFGNVVVDKKRTMADYFMVPPFSILNTTDGLWQERKKRWNLLINDTGQMREGVLASHSTDIMKEIGSASILDAVLAEVIIKWFTEPGHRTLDPFAGDTVFGYVSGMKKRPFVGIEIRKEQADFNQKACSEAGLDCVYHCDTSANMDEYVGDNSMDFVFSCPPYADLETYSKIDGDLSNMNRDDFFDMYGKILANTYRKLKENRFAVIVTSEVRDKEGAYIQLMPRTISAMMEAGYLYYNDIILVNTIGTLPLRTNAPMNTGRKIGRRHQNVLVFYKGDPNEIKQNYSEIIPKNEYYTTQ